MARSTDFNLAALYTAVDRQREARRLSWAQVVREIGGRSGSASVGSLSRSTVMNLRTGSIAEGDGVLQILRWLHRIPESFVPGCKAVGSAFELPILPAGQVLRFDTKKLHAALDARRLARRVTWRQVADEIGGVGASSLTHLKEGGRVAFPCVMRVVGWLDQPAATFVRGCNR